jgi:hypothetical protein
MGEDCRYRTGSPAVTSVIGLSVLSHKSLRNKSKPIKLAMSQHDTKLREEKMSLMMRISEEWKELHRQLMVI